MPKGMNNTTTPCKWNLQHEFLLMKWVNEYNKMNWMNEHPSKENNIELGNNIKWNFEPEQWILDYERCKETCKGAYPMLPMTTAMDA